MNNIENNTNKPSIFKNQKNNMKANQLRKSLLQTNDGARKRKLDQIAKNDAKIDIPEAVKDFSRIKKAVDLAPEIDNTEKIARLKEQINSGSYKVNYEALADKLLESELR